jgi:uncharacterized membrane protein YcaP (DUF421 family)
MRSNWLSGFVKGKADVLVRGGVIDRAATLRHDVSQDDLAEALRLQKIERVEDVGLATFERGGKISAIPRGN